MMRHRVNRDSAGYVRVLRMFVVLLAGVLLLGAAGCDRAGGRGGSRAPTGVLRIGNWIDYLSEDVMAAFTEETGIPVQLETFASVGQMMGRLEADPSVYDLIITDDSVVESMKNLRLLLPIDHSLIPNLALIDPHYLDQAYDPNNEYSVPYAVGATVLAFRSDRIPEADSWEVLWDPRNAGHVAMLDDSQELCGIASLVLGLPVDTIEPAEFARIEAKLKAQLPLVTGYFDLEVLLEGLDSGEIWAAPVYGMDAASLAEENEHVAYVLPKEGAIVWIDSFAIPRDARNPEAAHRFIDFVNRPDVCAENANEIWMLTPNGAAVEDLSPEILEDEALAPRGKTLERCEFFRALNEEITGLQNHLMEELRRSLLFRESNAGES